jgi:ComF family protein
VFLHALQNLRDGLLSLAYPQDCRLCSRSVESWNNGIVCPDCWHNPQITKLFGNHNGCAKCGIPLPRPQQFPAACQSNATHNAADVTVPSQESYCHRCDGLVFAAARACGQYCGTLEANVLFLKSVPHLCARLRQIVVQTYDLNRSVLESDLVIPVPLHPTRKQERGFNQAEVIARAIAAEFHLDLEPDLLVRVKNTERHRAGLDEVDRAKSVEQAFKVVRPELLKTSSVLLVDDVFTTGHTLSAAAQSLLASGATQVKVLTLARVVK